MPAQEGGEDKLSGPGGVCPPRDTVPTAFSGPGRVPACM